MGLGAMWRTGAMAYHDVVRQGLGLQAHERLIGYLYIGEVQSKSRVLPNLAVADFVTAWPSNG